MSRVISLSRSTSPQLAGQTALGTTRSRMFSRPSLLKTSNPYGGKPYPSPLWQGRMGAWRFYPSRNTSECLGAQSHLVFKFIGPPSYFQIPNQAGGSRPSTTVAIFSTIHTTARRRGPGGSPPNKIPRKNPRRMTPFRFSIQGPDIFFPNS